MDKAPSGDDITRRAIAPRPEHPGRHQEVIDAGATQSQELPWQLRDPATGEWATRNIYLDHMPAGARETGVRPLQARGAIFWQCNNALNGVAHELADDTKQPFEQVRAELLAGLNPGVRLVPAHTMVLGLAQERGFAYEQIG